MRAPRFRRPTAIHPAPPTPTPRPSPPWFATFVALVLLVIAVHLFLGTLNVRQPIMQGHEMVVVDASETNWAAPLEVEYIVDRGSDTYEFYVYAVTGSETGTISLRVGGDESSAAFSSCGELQPGGEQIDLEFVSATIPYEGWSDFEDSKELNLTIPPTSAGTVACTLDYAALSPRDSTVAWVLVPNTALRETNAGAGCLAVNIGQVYGGQPQSTSCTGGSTGAALTQIGARTVEDDVTARFALFYYSVFSTPLTRFAEAHAQTVFVSGVLVGVSGAFLAPLVSWFAPGSQLLRRRQR